MPVYVVEMVRGTQGVLDGNHRSRSLKWQYTGIGMPFMAMTAQALPRVSEMSAIRESVLAFGLRDQHGNSV